jgi:hypothetical protein
MSIAKAAKCSVTIAVIVIATMALLVFGCSETPKPAATDKTGAPTSTSPGQVPIDIVVGKVGDGDIKLGDLLYSAQVLAYFQQGIANNEIYTQEAKKRGVYPTPEKIDESFNKTLESQGGMEGLMKSLPPALKSIPQDLIMNEIRKQSVMQLLQQAIVEDEYKKVKGEPTQAELDQMWTQQGDGLKGQIASENKIKPEEVTQEMALPKLKDAIKQKWMGENGQKLFEELTKSYTVQNYILDQYIKDHPVKEEAVVPTVGAPEGAVKLPGAPPASPSGGK